MVGDRVGMEPGISDPNSRAMHLGLDNFDPAMRFWATPPVYGCLRPTVVHLQRLCSSSRRRAGNRIGGARNRAAGRSGRVEEADGLCWRCA